MRISTSQIHRQGTQAILARQAEAAKAQQQLSSGKRILSPSDDPIASARLLSLHEQSAATEQQQRNLSFASGRLSLEETALEQAGNVLQQVRELTVQANTDTLSNSDRNAIATQIRQLHGQLMGLANTKDGNGEYLFAGFKTHTEPFVAGSSGVNYQGDDEQRLVQVGPSLQIAIGDSGEQVFRKIPNGNGSFSVAVNSANTGTGTIAVGSVTDPVAFQASASYRIEFTSATNFNVIDAATGNSLLSSQTYSDGQAIQFAGIQTAISGTPSAGDKFTIQPSANQDLFTTLDKIVGALEKSAVTPKATAELHQALNNALADLDQGLDHLSGQRAEVGARLAALDSQDQANQDFQLHLQETISAVGDLDYAEAATRLSEGLITLQAAQQSFLRIQNLSLFNFIK